MGTQSPLSVKPTVPKVQETFLLKYTSGIFNIACNAVSFLFFPSFLKFEQSDLKKKKKLLPVMVSVLLDYLRVSDSSLPVAPTPFISSGFFLLEWVPPLSSWYLTHSYLCHYAFLLSEDTSTGMGFPGGADGKVSACSAGGPGLIPGSGQSLEKGMATHSRSLAGYSLWGRRVRYN